MLRQTVPRRKPSARKSQVSVIAAGRSGGMFETIMPDIAEFRALTYDPSRVDLSQVVTPPYDVIDPSQRAVFAQRSPYNFVRIDIPEPESDRGSERYRVAADRLQCWLAEGVLRHDSIPALYRYHQTFIDPDRARSVTRRGLIAGVALSPWSDGVILPHETTLSAPREDRARLLAATRVHLSPVFAMYDDSTGAIERMFESCSQTPDLVATTDDRTVHQVWRITVPEIVNRASDFLREKRAYMLDGHHRYETMVAHRDRDDSTGDLQGARGVRRGPMFLVPMSDPGLIILPTHRIVIGVPDMTREKFLVEVQRYCQVQRVAGGARDAAKLRHALEASPDVPTFAAVFPHDPDAHVLSLVGHEVNPEIETEIAVLHEVILQRVLAIPAAARGAEPNLRYHSNTQGVLDQIASGAGQLALMVRPPKLSQVKKLADRGRVMPEKSTYFFPKLASGLVMMPVER